jgi:hypothetical protein
MTLLNRQQEHIEAWRQSGLTKSAYCRAQGINLKNFYRWCRLENLTQESVKASSIIPITVEVPTPSPESIVLHLTPGHRLELPAKVSSRWLGELLQCLA